MEPFENFSRFYESHHTTFLIWECVSSKILTGEHRKLLVDIKGSPWFVVSPSSATNEGICQPFCKECVWTTKYIHVANLLDFRPIFSPAEIFHGPWAKQRIGLVEGPRWGRFGKVSATKNLQNFPVLQVRYKDYFIGPEIRIWTLTDYLEDEL